MEVYIDREDFLYPCLLVKFFQITADGENRSLFEKSSAKKLYIRVYLKIARQKAAPKQTSALAEAP